MSRCVVRMVRILPVVLVERGSVRQNRRVRTLVLYPFRFRDRITGKWVRAPHKLQVHPFVPQGESPISEVPPRGQTLVD
jgi:hypothetical protein